MRKRKCVFWRNRHENPPREGWCVEISRDRNHTVSSTLCDHSIPLPGYVEVREPTCVDCIEIINRRSKKK